MPVDPNREIRPLKPLPALIFASRWLQLPLYLGLIVAQVVYVVLFLWDPATLGHTMERMGLGQLQKETVIMAQGTGAAH